MSDDEPESNLYRYAFGYGDRKPNVLHLVVIPAVSGIIALLIVYGVARWMHG